MIPEVTLTDTLISLVVDFVIPTLIYLYILKRYWMPVDRKSYAVRWALWVPFVHISFIFQFIVLVIKTLAMDTGESAVGPLLRLLANISFIHMGLGILIYLSIGMLIFYILGRLIAIRRYPDHSKATVEAS